MCTHAEKRGLSREYTVNLGKMIAIITWSAALDNVC